jgi:diadenylate cyclase
MEFIDFIFKYLSMVKPVDIIDIVIVSYIVYKIIYFIRETRAEQLLKGIFLLLLLLQVSEWFHLNAINFLLRNTMQVGLLAFLIVFQPELRRILERMGRSRIGTFTFFGVDDQYKETETLTPSKTSARR